MNRFRTLVATAASAARIGSWFRSRHHRSRGHRQRRRVLGSPDRRNYVLLLLLTHSDMALAVDAEFRITGMRTA